jgi:hypothetical protein
MERLDQGHPLLEHSETNMSRPGLEPACVTGEHLNIIEELFDAAANMNLYSIGIHFLFIIGIYKKPVSNEKKL